MPSEAHLLIYFPNSLPSFIMTSCTSGQIIMRMIVCVLSLDSKVMSCSNAF